MPRGADAMFFLGTTPYQLDDKNRVAIPPKYRAEFVGGGVLTTGEEPCVMLYTIDGFETRAAQYIEIPDETEAGRDAWRDFFGNAQSVERDAQGRITIDRKLAGHAGLTKEVYVVGVRDRLEIWDQATWDGREEARANARREQLSQLPERRNQRGTGG